MPPTIHSARGTDSTSIQFSLSPSLPYYAAYEVTGYNVRYWKLETSSYLIREFSPGTVTANLTANLTALDAYTEYCLSAQAVTIHGPGIYGPCITAVTNESGNKKKNNFLIP